jgi:hypothetical protein
MYIGKYTIARRNTQLDGNGECSANASDTNWCGPYYSNDAIEQGDYKNGEVRQSYLPAAPPSLIGEGDGGGDG